MLLDSSYSENQIRSSINENYRCNESQYLGYLLNQAKLTDSEAQAAKAKALIFVKHVREARKNATGIDSFLSEYSLSSDEGIALMCLAESLLRTPDKTTIDDLIRDKLSQGDWASHKGASSSFFVNATTWALMLTGKIITPEKAENSVSKALLGFMNKTSEPVIRKVVLQAMRVMSRQFIMGENIKDAIERAQKKEAKGYRYSYDILGEAALTLEDSEKFYQSYQTAINAIGSSINNACLIHENPGISIKLSALYPRYHEAFRKDVMAYLVPRLINLVSLAKTNHIGVTIDAEESERLSLSLDIIEQVALDENLKDFEGFGLAVQSYQKRAYSLIDWVANLAKKRGHRLSIRLIKGAYWDSEIKKAQALGLSSYPVFTRKVFTDVSFQACAKKLFTLTEYIYPQFATHNAYSVAMILSIAGDYRDFEFQCLHGMGSELYEEIVPKDKLGIPCRVYAPVGTHQDLLPYLVRRLLENGANTSFVNRIIDDEQPLENLVINPVETAQSLLSRINQNIPLPKDIFKPYRENSNGLDLSDRAVLNQLMHFYQDNPHQTWQAKPLILNHECKGSSSPIYSPQISDKLIGQVIEAQEIEAKKAIENAQNYFSAWSQKPVLERADLLRAFAAELESNRYELYRYLCLEAGKTWSDAVGEVREAIDFCYYYARKAEHHMGQALELKGYTGETNLLSLHPRGPVLCISPWNFPLAIFVGQIVASLVVGNTVIAKPAEQTPCIAYFAISLMIKAGIPLGVIQLLPGKGETIGKYCVKSPDIKAVLFTGSTITAKYIQRDLAEREGEIVPLIAETGGMNTMIVDSSALLEQVTNDVVQSAFGSAGQRCSALRVLYIQEDVYPRFETLLQGAMSLLQLGDPALLSTDIGPVIDRDAHKKIAAHIQFLELEHQVIHKCSIDNTLYGHFIGPIAAKIPSITLLKEEIFGPVLHVITYSKSNLDKVIHDINASGYGLTLGIHSRINETVSYIQSRLHVGNCYVNRNMIGAVVGLQPFGGEGLSGTGPKAGGPHYLPRLCVERTLTIDTTAQGGNAYLMSLPEEL